MSSCRGIPRCKERPEFFFAAGEVGFHGAERPAQQRGDFGVRQTFVVAKVQGGALVGRERPQGQREVSFQVARRCGRRDLVLCRQMLGLERPSRGEVRVFGVSLHGSDSAELRKLRDRWGMLFQEGALFSALTVYTS